MTNSILGSGMLALPYGVRTAGLGAIILLGIAAWLVKRSYYFLILSFHEDGDLSKPQLRYNHRHVAYTVFGQPGKIFVGVLARLLYIMLAGAWLELSAEALGSISYVFSPFSWVVLSALVVLMLVILVPNLNDMSWLGAIGILNTIIFVTTIMVVSIQCIIEHPQDSLDVLKYPIFKIEGIFITLPIYQLSMGCVFAISPVYCAMKDQSRFPWLMDLVYFIVTTGKIVFTLTAFIAFQDKTEDVISLNISSYVARTIVSVAIVTDKLITIPIVLYSTRREIQSQLSNYFGIKGYISDIALRILVTSALLSVSSAIAMVVPSFALLVSLIGSAFVYVLSMIIPLTCWAVLSKRKSVYDLVSAGVIMIASIIIIVGGLYSNIMRLKNVSYSYG